MDTQLLRQAHPSVRVHHTFYFAHLKYARHTDPGKQPRHVVFRELKSYSDHRLDLFQVISGSTLCRVFIGQRRSENSPAKFCLFPERAWPFHNNPPVTLQYSPATLILNENPAFEWAWTYPTGLPPASWDSPPVEFISVFLVTLK